MASHRFSSTTFSAWLFSSFELFILKRNKVSLVPVAVRSNITCLAATHWCRNQSMEKGRKKVIVMPTSATNWCPSRKLPQTLALVFNWHMSPWLIHHRPISKDCVFSKNRTKQMYLNIMKNDKTEVFTVSYVFSSWIFFNMYINKVTHHNVLIRTALQVGPVWKW